ncbi:hypothetical protein CVT25_003894, partial [Psilocybe cyanescens]
HVPVTYLFPPPLVSPFPSASFRRLHYDPYPHTPTSSSLPSMKSQVRHSYGVCLLSRPDMILAPLAISSIITPSASMFGLDIDCDGECTPLLVDFTNKGEDSVHGLRTLVHSNLSLRSVNGAVKTCGKRVVPVTLVVLWVYIRGGEEARGWRVEGRNRSRRKPIWLWESECEAEEVRSQ